MIAEMEKVKLAIKPLRKRRKMTQHLATFIHELFNLTFSFLSQPDSPASTRPT